MTKHAGLYAFSGCQVTHKCARRRPASDLLPQRNLIHQVSNQPLLMRRQLPVLCQQVQFRRGGVCSRRYLGDSHRLTRLSVAYAQLEPLFRHVEHRRQYGNLFRCRAALTSQPLLCSLFADWGTLIPQVELLRQLRRGLDLPSAARESQFESCRKSSGFFRGCHFRSLDAARLTATTSRLSMTTAVDILRQNIEGGQNGKKEI